MRTFIAFDLAEETKNIILKIQDDFRKTTSAKISYTNISQFHLTVFFLGELGEKGIERIIKILGKKELTGPLTLNFDLIDYFPSAKRPNVIVLKSEPDIYLKNFVKNLDLDLLKLDFRCDKKWVPHITLGRVRDSFSPGEFNFVPFSAKIESLVLYKSTLTKSGSVYEKLFGIKVPISEK